MFRNAIFAASLAAVTIGGFAGSAEARTRHHSHQAYDNHYANRQYDERRCHGSGATGLIVGGVAGGLAGNAIAGDGHRTAGTVLGAAGGGLLGRSIDRHRTTRC